MSRYSGERKDGGVAFPLSLAVGPAGDLYDSTNADPGMSLRQWYAGQALPGVANAIFSDYKLVKQAEKDGLTVEQAIANACDKIADAMLKARAKGER